MGQAPQTSLTRVSRAMGSRNSRNSEKGTVLLIDSQQFSDFFSEVLKKSENWDPTEKTMRAYLSKIVWCQHTQKKLSLIVLMAITGLNKNRLSQKGHCQILVLWYCYSEKVQIIRLVYILSAKLIKINLSNHQHEISKGFVLFFFHKLSLFKPCWAHSSPLDCDYRNEALNCVLVSRGRPEKPLSSSAWFQCFSCFDATKEIIHRFLPLLDKWNAWAFLEWL